MSATCEMRMSHALSGLAPDAYRTPRALPWALGLLPPRGAPCLESGLRGWQTRPKPGCCETQFELNFVNVVIGWGLTSGRG